MTNATDELCALCGVRKGEHKMEAPPPLGTYWLCTPCLEYEKAVAEAMKAKERQDKTK